MAASAYAALASLYNALEQIQHPVRHRLFDTSQIETLREMVSFLLDLFANYSKVVCDTDVQDFVRFITNCAQEAEDSIDSYVVDHLTQRSADKVHISKSSFCEDIDRVIQKMKRSKKAMVEFTEEKSSRQTQLRPSVSMPIPYGKKTMVGFDDHLTQIMHRLKGGESGLQIVPIVGMGGIGKTTLAQNVFHHPCFKDHFDIRIWFTISQEYSVQDILSGLLHGKGEVGHDKKNKESCAHDIAELGKELYQKLFGQTYLIVLDDVWSINVWEDLKFYFPDNQKGNRIIVTTRLSSVADSLGGHNSYSVGLLDDEKSLELFCGEVFGKKGCHDPELLKIGKDIAKDCKGLPLAIVVIGGLLSKSNMTREYWEEVAKNVNSIVNSNDNELCLNILCLSYNQLPIHLKPCFLYMRIFPEDYKVRFSKLIKYWIAEGFIISKGGKTLEEVGEEYLEDLIGRNLILINIEEYDGWSLGKRKMCGIHDFLRDLCLREHYKENIFRITKIYDSNLVYYCNICLMCMDRDESRTVFLPLLPCDDLQKSFAPCLLCDICGMICPELRWASVVDPKYDLAFPLTTKLGFLDFRTNHFVSISLPIFWNLQNLIVDYEDKIDLPSEIWEMPQLRHVKINNYVIFHDPPVTLNDRKDSIILDKLETLFFLLDFRCSEESLERIPNLKKLKIAYDQYEEDGFSYYLLHNLVRLRKLESLFLRGGFLNREMIAFPQSLKKLTLQFSTFSWEELTIIGLLSNLEVLRLFHCFTGEEWNPVEGEFLQLKYLSIFSCVDLVHWNAKREHFPKLESLVLGNMNRLHKFPSGIGEIDTLLLIGLLWCPDSVVDSAKEIVEEQKTYGNELLQLHIDE